MTVFAKRKAQLDYVIRRIAVGAVQAAALRRRERTARNLVVFTAPGYDGINGGLLSIYSLYRESRRLLAEQAEVVLCTLPTAIPFARYSRFTCEDTLYTLPQALSYFTHVESLLLHIPEAFVAAFLQSLTDRQRRALAEVDRVQLNVLVQNIDLLDGQPLDQLRELGTVTATTAHARYTSAELRERLGVPIHRFSTFVSPEQYERRAYGAKEELLVVSPDEHPSKAAILDCIARAQPHLEIVEVRDLKYDDYKDLIARAKWCLTFGEGLDGYFVESVWSGAVAFAVYNDRFFTQPFSDLRTVYADYASLAAAIAADMRHLDHLVRFTEYQRQQWELCASLYQYETYVENVRLFYAGEYTLP